MRSKILIASGLVVAFLVGAMANGIYTVTTRAFNPIDQKATAIESQRPVVPAVNRTHFVQPRTVYVSNPAPSRAVVSTSQQKRSLGREALIVGGSAGAGAAVGAVAGGKKGAAVGAISGGVAGLVYDLITRN